MEKLPLSALQEIFGRAMFAKLRERPTRHQLPGKHTGGHYGRIKVVDARVEGEDKTTEVACRHHVDHPAGTKLVRRFIRRSRGEATAYRNLYAQLTGHQYS